jgi:hypothetical protein
VEVILLLLEETHPQLALTLEFTEYRTPRVIRTQQRLGIILLLVGICLQLQEDILLQADYILMRLGRAVKPLAITLPRLGIMHSLLVVIPERLETIVRQVQVIRTQEVFV